MINVVWFKRDIRWVDHAPLKAAIENQRPTILLYIYEPSLFASDHYSERHWNFKPEICRSTISIAVPTAGAIATTGVD